MSKKSRESSRWVVLKFGGSSVSSLECWQTIAGLIEKRLQEGHKPVIVCSAFSGMSNALEELTDEPEGKRRADIFASIKNRHREMADELGVDFAVVKSDLAEMSAIMACKTENGEDAARLRARLLAFGEIMSTRLGAAFLKANGLKVAWQDARKYLVTDACQAGGTHRSYLLAKCNYERDDALKNSFNSEKAPAILTQGFIGSNEDGETVLFGRGGSDLSAAYFAAKLGAARCEIWTDVPGMYTANPHNVPSARLIKALDYAEAQELASSGAKVLHPRCISPLSRHDIPLHIHCLKYPDVEGTIISSDAHPVDACVKAISSKQGVTLISMETADMWHQVGFLANVFACFEQHGLSVDLVSTSETNVTVTLDRAANASNPSAIESLVKDLERFCKPRAIHSCAFISLVGRDIRAILNQLGPAMEVFEEQMIYLLSQAANDLNLTFVVDDDQAERLVQKLHSQLIKQHGGDRLFGQTWEELFQPRETPRAYTSKAWWYHRRDELISLASKKTPLYVYDGNTIGEMLSCLSEMEAVDRMFYSVKANSHPKVLEMVYQAGLGLECVSIGEVNHTLGIFPEIDPERILFTPNFAPRSEYERALEIGVKVTVDNLFPIDAWPDLFRNSNIIVRVDPGRGYGHHKYVHTAGAESKFGILPTQLGDLKKLARKCGMRIVGLHAHVGSNIFTAETWSETALFLASIADDFSDVVALDVGGGLGVLDRSGQAELDLSKVDECLKGVKRRHPKYEIWMEPGRFIIAEAGVLLTKVTQTKQKDEYHYVGVDAGMNTLIRPALYGSHHEIVNLSRVDERESVVANIVGPICESGDILGYERRIATPGEGDILLIATAGAYGRVMSSTYNMRPLAEECFINR